MSNFAVARQDGTIAAKNQAPFFASLIGACFSQGQHRIGVDQGPNVLLEPLQKMYNLDEDAVQQVHPKHPGRIDEKQDRNWTEDYVYLFDLLLASAGTSLLIGGDHSIGMPSVAASMEKVDQVSNLYVLWIDAHADINTFQASTSKNYHGMPLAGIFGLEKPWLPIRGTLPFSNLLYFGLRDVDDFEQGVVQKEGVFYTSDAKSMLDKIQDICRQNPAAKFHVSWDVDSMDPTYVSATGCYCEDGLSPESVVEVLAAVKSHMVAMDLTEFNPCMGDEERSLKTVLSVMNLFCS